MFSPLKVVCFTKLSKIRNSSSDNLFKLELTPAFFDRGFFFDWTLSRNPITILR